MHTSLVVVALLGTGRAQPQRIGEVSFARATLPVDSTAFSIADLDGDGDADLLAGGERVTVLLGDGRGNLEIAGRIDAGEQPVSFAVADLDVDGDADAAVANHDTRYITYLHGDGRGGFRASRTTVGVDPHPHAIGAADIDGDGRLDLVIDHRNGRGLLVLRGLGGGRFEREGTLIDVGGDPYRGMAIADLNGDGRPDFVTPNPAHVAVVINEGEGGELSFAGPDLLRASGPFCIAIADLNADGRPDIVAGSGEGSDRVHVFFGDGRGGFGEGERSPIRFERGPKSVAIGDFDGDGHQDAALTSYGSSRVMILLGDPGELGRAWLTAGEHPWGIAAGDLNGDGRDDLVVGDDAGARVFVYLSSE